MKKKNSFYSFIAFLLTLGLFSCQPNKVQKSLPAGARTQVQGILDEQTACWSKGDLECFMQGYWKSDSLMFIGKNGLTYGWQQTLDNYGRNYPSAQAMGKLEFNILEMKPLSDETMLVIGKWMLTREEVGNLEGHFSVIFERFPDGWKIIADHSS